MDPPRQVPVSLISLTPRASQPRPTTSMRPNPQTPSSSSLVQARLAQVMRPVHQTPTSSSVGLQSRHTQVLRSAHQAPTASSLVLPPRPTNITPATTSQLAVMPTAPGIIRPSTFRPLFPRTPERVDEMLNAAQAQIRARASGASKRQEPSSTERPAKRLASSSLGNESAITSNSIIWDDPIMDDFTCSLCFQQFEEPHITGCGHTYCLSCIDRFMLVNPRCPNCTVEVKRQQVAPNRAIYQLMRKAKLNAKALDTELATAAAHVPGNGNAFAELDIQSFFQKKYKDLSMGEVEILIAMLSRKKEVLLTESQECRESLISAFLTELKRLKQAELQKVQDELLYIEDDLAIVQKEAHEKANSKLSGTSVTDSLVDGDCTLLRDKEESVSAKNSKKNLENPPVDSSLEVGAAVTNQRLPPPKDIGFSATDRGLQELVPSVAQRKVKIHSHFNELAKIYLKACSTGTPKKQRVSDTDTNIKTNENLENFTEALVRISRYTGFKQLATLTYTSDTLLNANIVSTIEFDKDKDFFAIAGITKKIKLFEYASVIAAAVNMQCPNGEIICPSKISCLSYSHFYKNKLASSDYEGKVNLWDTSTCEQIVSLNEHEKRVWSVDFSDGDPRFLVSGSDDCKVKLWSINQQNSGVTLNTVANVCCVKFLPQSSYKVAFGSADHCIHYYDFRQPKTPLRVYSGHKKAVSYVKFSSSTELISASTDSNLKMWDLTGTECVRSYVGHVNDKNFVGLTTDGNYIACGSENNSIYIYYKHVPYPILSYKFENYRSMIHPVRQEEISCEFVSAVTWRTGSPVVVAANSQGIIKVLELV